MRSTLVIVPLTAFGLCACTSSTLFAAGPALFASPYAAPVLDNGPVGPECEGGVIRDDQCYIDGQAYPIHGRYARDVNGNVIRLTRQERRRIREREEAIHSRADVLESLENGTPIPPDSPALRRNQSRPAPLPPTGD
ncbi:MAG: hypothetical protein ABJP70_12045 [Erythrobacter sp.]